MPRIYVACLASYNSGILHGDWIDVEAGDDADDVAERIKPILLSSPCPNVEVDCPDCDGMGSVDGEECDTCKGTGKVPSAEEYAIHDHEGWEGLPIGEYTDLDTLCQWAEALEEHGVAYALYADHVGAAYASVEDFQERYQGEWDSLEEYAENFCDDVGYLQECPDSLKWYIDYRSMAHDWERGGDIFSVEKDGKVYVFHNH